ncbi:hypothetical protein BJG93_21520 [Paraburkholderia sprentiae WSM5005]|uniref:Uncharacterized protein n=1 Tax=Paraburkholderia sprentiae WSM5005 TaxID=754502 RepID=A0A1I9YNW2_9BURK|nr:hypothetical protein [Paraburkholderia sprentiae]APA87995.1 hypothetical protein BJG93_21520 [Paraburkholderia sprentiae WSM5005]
MQHTVIGLFDTYMQAENARDTLVQTGFAREKVELQANPEPSVGSATSEVANAGVLANIERFLASLFSTGPRASDTARYAEAMRRGAVLVCVRAASQSHAELARNTLVRLGATDIGDRLPEADTPVASGRDHSVLDELGIGAVMPGTPRTSSVTTEARATPGMRDTTATPGATGARSTGGAVGAAGAAGVTESTGIAGATGATSATGPSAADTSTSTEPFAPPPISERPTSDPANEPIADPLAGDAGRSAIAAGSAPGSGAVMQPSDIVPEGGQPGAGPGAQMPNEYLEYEEDFRTHYDEQYAAANARYEDYVPAYRYGAEIGRDARFRNRPWEEIEPEARRHWESTSSESTWERFKLAVRHGWERVTGHHHV